MKKLIFSFSAAMLTFSFLCFAGITNGLEIETGKAGSECGEGFCVSPESTPENIVCVACDEGMGDVLPGGAVSNGGNPNGNQESQLRAKAAKIKREVGALSGTKHSQAQVKDKAKSLATPAVIRTKNSKYQVEDSIENKLVGHSGNFTSTEKIKIKANY